MRHQHDGAPPLGKIIDRPENHRLVIGVKTARRLVEQHQIGVAKEHAGQSDALFLTLRKAATQLADLRIQAVRQRIDQFERGRLARASRNTESGMSCARSESEESAESPSALLLELLQKLLPELLPESEKSASLQTIARFSRIVPSNRYVSCPIIVCTRRRHPASTCGNGTSDSEIVPESGSQ